MLPRVTMPKITLENERKKIKLRVQVPLVFLKIKTSTLSQPVFLQAIPEVQFSEVLETHRSQSVAGPSENLAQKRTPAFAVGELLKSRHDCFMSSFLLLKGMTRPRSRTPQFCSLFFTLQAYYKECKKESLVLALWLECNWAALFIIQPALQQLHRVPTAYQFAWDTLAYRESAPHYIVIQCCVEIGGSCGEDR